MGRMNKFTLLRAVIIAMRGYLMDEMAVISLPNEDNNSNLAEIIRLNLKQRASKMRQSPVVNHLLFTCIPTC